MNRKSKKYILALFSIISIITLILGLNVYANNQDYNHKDKIKDSQELFTIKSIGDWFQTILKSYAGIGAIITYILIVYNFVSTLIENTGDPRVFMNIPSLILWLGLPFYLVVSLIPALICNDLIKNHRIKFIRNIGERIGITHTAIISFELKKDSENLF